MALGSSIMQDAHSSKRGLSNQKPGGVTCLIFDYPYSETPVPCGSMYNQYLCEHCEACRRGCTHDSGEPRPPATPRLQAASAKHLPRAGHFTPKWNKMSQENSYGTMTLLTLSQSKFPFSRLPTQSSQELGRQHDSPAGHSASCLNHLRSY